jgi:RNA polymerase sigma factor (TIGR02999 family)
VAGAEEQAGADGDRAALDALYSAAYEELRRLAATISGEEGRGTLNPTALANEAWLKLAASPQLRWSSQLHFKRIAARAMRQVLVEAARRRSASKRGGAASLVTFDEDAADCNADARQLLAIDEALHDLARVSPRQAQMVESRFFGGMDIPETARLLQVSEATVQRDWRAARAWLARELRR